MNIIRDDKDKLLEVLKEHSPQGIVGMFPKDIREKTQWGYAKIKAVCDDLIQDGQVRKEDDFETGKTRSLFYAIMSDKLAQIMAYMIAGKECDTSELCDLTGLEFGQVNEILVQLVQMNIIRILGGLRVKLVKEE